MLLKSIPIILALPLALLTSAFLPQVLQLLVGAGLGACWSVYMQPGCSPAGSMMRRGEALPSASVSQAQES